MHIPQAGGPPQHLRPWLEPLAERGTLEVIAPRKGAALALYEPIAATAALPYEPLTFPRSPLQAASLARRLAREVRLFRSHIRRSRPDLVVVVTSVVPSALIAARLERVPAIVYVAEIFDKGFVRGPLRAASGAAVRGLTERVASGLICCSRAVADQFDLDKGLTPTVIAYPGVKVPSRSGDREGFRRAHGVTGASPCVAVLGNLSRGRGQDLALRALAALRPELPETRLLVAGIALDRPIDRAYEQELWKLAHELGVRDLVRFTGFVDNVEDVYAAADIVLNPARFNEPLGRVALEALVAARPVVAARVGGMPEALRHRVDALLVPRDDPAAMAAAIAELWHDEDLRERLVASGRSRVLREFGEDRGRVAFMSLVDHVLRGTRPSGSRAAA